MIDMMCPECGVKLEWHPITKSRLSEEHDWYELKCPVHGLMYSGEKHALERIKRVPEK